VTLVWLAKFLVGRLGRGASPRGEMWAEVFIPLLPEGFREIDADSVEFTGVKSVGQA